MPKRNLAWIAVIALIAAAFWKLPQTAARYDTLDRAFGALIAVRSRIANYYVEPVDDEALVTGAIRGMLRELDPHSVYISPRELADFTKQSEGRFGGIGIALDDPPIEGGRELVVLSPMEDTPAFHAGILAGDRILAVDGEPIESFATVPELMIQEAMHRISGEPGTPVTLTLRQPGQPASRDITIRRAIIRIASVTGWYRPGGVEWEYFVDKPSRIGYVRLSGFVAETYDQLRQTLSDLRERGMAGLVLDLRDNSGGLLDSAINVSDLFLSEGIILTTRRMDQLVNTWEASRENTVSDFPVVILINRSSASAAEIVAGALRDHDRAVLVGERSYGKGSVQNVYELPPPHDGGRMKLTVAYYHLPSGRCIHRKPKATDDEWGVHPDELVALTDDELRAMWDARRKSGIVYSTATQPSAGPSAAASALPTTTPHPAPPAIDRQLARAIEILREQLASEPEPATARVEP